MKIMKKDKKSIFMAFIIFLSILLPVFSFSQTEKEKKMPQEGSKVESPAFSIEENMKKFKSKMEALEAKYTECCGSLLNVYLPTDLNKIAESLPKPKTITVNLSYPLPPWKDTKAVSKNRVFVKNYLIGEFYAPYPFFLGRGKEWIYGEEHIDWPWSIYTPVAACDKETSILLGIPHEVGLELRGLDGLYEEKGPRKDDRCCMDTDQKGVCKKYAMVYDYERVTSRGIHPSNLQVEIAGGGEVLGGGSGVKFTQPGSKKVSFESPMKIEFNREYCKYINCAGSDILVRCEPAGTVKSSYPLNITAIKLKEFGIPGLDFEGKEHPKLDYFLKAGKKNIGYENYLSRPAVLVDDGENKRSIYGFGELVTTSYGPVVIAPYGPYQYEVSYLGGIGSTKFKTRHSYLEGKEHEITVNAVETIYDSSIGAKEVVAQKKYKVTLLVNGPANMKKYSATWKGTTKKSVKGVEIGISWDKERTEFQKVGELWSSSNTFQINYKGYKPENDKIPFLIESRIVRNSDGKEVYNDISEEFYVSHPGIAELKLYVSTDGKTFMEPPSSIDIFTAPLTGNFKTRDVYVCPYIVLADKSIYPMSQVTSYAKVEFKHSNPGVATIFYGEKDMLKVNGNSAGRTDITVRVGKDIQYNIGIIQGDELASKPVKFNVNVIQPVIVESGGKKRTYKLSVETPTYFEEKYQVVWIGKKGRTTTPFVDEGFYANATITTDSEITGIQIIDAKKEVVAEIGVNEKSSVAKIKLLPPEIPVTVIGKQDLVDVGSLETIAQCVEKVTWQINHMGFEPGKTPQEYCLDRRKEQKEEIKKLRESQKEMNKLVKELDKQGKELVVFSDKATVAAVVEVPGYLDKKGLFCYWRLIDAHAQLVFQDQVSPIQWAMDNKGGCFNVVSGIQNYLTPEAKVKVELRMDTTRQNNVQVVSPVESWEVSKDRGFFKIR